MSESVLPISEQKMMFMEVDLSAIEEALTPDEPDTVTTTLMKEKVY